MSGALENTAAIAIVDRHAARMALAHGPKGLRLPEAGLHASDGCVAASMTMLNKAALGADRTRSAAFADAAIRAAYDTLGWLIARRAEAPTGSTGPLSGLERLSVHQLAPARGDLVYLGRALSPAGATRRRHVRVFAASFASVSNSLVRPASARGIAWLTPAEAEAQLSDPLTAPFAARVVNAFSARHKALMVSFRAGRRLTRTL